MKTRNRETHRNQRTFYKKKNIARKKIIEMQYVDSKENIVDIMTKVLVKDRFIKLRKGTTINNP